MRDNVRYCDLCGKRLTPEDFAVGDADERSRGRAYCLECTKKIPHTVKERAIVPKIQRPSASSRRLKAIKRRGRRSRRRVSTRRVASSRIVPQPEQAPGQVPTAHVTCPYCQEKFLVEVPEVPQDFTCPACGKGMRVQRPGSGIRPGM